MVVKAKPEADRKTVSCPDCGSSSIGERNVSFAVFPVTEWEFSDAAAPQPGGYGDDGDITPWQTGLPARAYVCVTCAWAGSLEELRVLDAEAPAAEAASDIVDGAAELELMGKKALVFNYLASVGEKHYREVADAVGITPGHANVELRELVELEHVERVGRGVYRAVAGAS